MNSKEFIINELNNILVSIPELTIRYQHKRNYDTHIVEVRPPSAFYQNKTYRALEFDIEERFEERFPAENILFITEDSLSKITNVEHEFKSGHFNFVVENTMPTNKLFHSIHLADSSKPDDLKKTLAISA